MWVLAQSSFTTAEIEAEYVWGLAHPSLFNGEGGYYLTTLTSAGEHDCLTNSNLTSLHLYPSFSLPLLPPLVNVLKELCGTPIHAPSPLPSMTHLQTELEIHIQDPSGQVSSIALLDPVTWSQPHTQKHTIVYYH